MPEWGVDGREIWTDEQLRRSELPERITMPVRQLLAAWRHVHHHETDRQDILDAFLRLAQDQALDIPLPENTRWVQVKPGYIAVADIVRVRPNAYSGDVGKRHNGRVCRVVAIRSGDVIVNAIDDGEKLEGVHHSPFALEKRVIER